MKRISPIFKLSTLIRTFFTLPYIYDRNKHAKYEFKTSLFYLAILEKKFFKSRSKGCRVASLCKHFVTTQELIIIAMLYLLVSDKNNKKKNNSAVSE